MSKKEQELETLFTPAVAALGLRVWGVEYLGQGKHSMLRIYIDRDEGVTIDDCEAVSKQVSELLDVEEVMTSRLHARSVVAGHGSCSVQAGTVPESIGETVDVRLNFPFEGRRRVIGALTGLENDEMVSSGRGSEYRFR